MLFKFASRIPFLLPSTLKVVAFSASVMFSQFAILDRLPSELTTRGPSRSSKDTVSPTCRMRQQQWRGGKLYQPAGWWQHLRGQEAQEPSSRHQILLLPLVHEFRGYYSCVIQRVMAQTCIHVRACWSVLGHVSN